MSPGLCHFLDCLSHWISDVPKQLPAVFPGNVSCCLRQELETRFEASAEGTVIELLRSKAPGRGERTSRLRQEVSLWKNARREL